MNTTNKIYQSILSGVLDTNCKSENEFADYLQSLKPLVRELRCEYKRNNWVAINYACENMQAAYLLTYFPHYTDMLWKIFLRHGKEIGIPKNLSVFGGGPCPEIIGLLRWLGETNPVCAEKLTVTSYDNNQNWMSSLDVVRKRVIVDVKELLGMNMNVYLNFEYADFVEKFPRAQLEPEFCVFQNMLNEIPEQSRNAFVNNFVEFYESLKIGSWICFINAGESESRAQSVMNSIQQLLTFDSKKQVLQHKTSFTQEPEMLTKHLLDGTDGLIAKRKLPFHYILFHKK